MELKNKTLSKKDNPLKQKKDKIDTECSGYT